MHIYQLSGRNLEVTEALQNYVEEKFSRLERFNSHITDARVVLSVRDVSDGVGRNRVEAQINVPGGIIRAEEQSADMYAAIDKASDVLERQLRKFKTRLMRQRHDAKGEALGEVSMPALQDDVTAFLPEIVRQKQFDMRPMSPEDAALQMEALGHDFYVFETVQGSFAVIYRRKDGHYGLIQPK